MLKKQQSRLKKASQRHALTNMQIYINGEKEQGF